MREKYLIFVSSTSDLAKEREELAEALRVNFDPFLFEKEAAPGTSPEEHCREMIRKADVFVCVLGGAYGSAYSRVGEEKSIVEWEYETALARDDLQILPFVKSLPAATTIDPRQNQFLARVKDFHKGQWVKFFTNPNELVRDTLHALQAWSLSLVRRSKEESARRADPRIRFLGILAAATGIALLALGVLAFTIYPLTRVTMLTLCAVGFVIVTGCFILSTNETRGG